MPSRPLQTWVLKHSNIFVYFNRWNFKIYFGYLFVSFTFLLHYVLLILMPLRRQFQGPYRQANMRYSSILTSRLFLTVNKDTWAWLSSCLDANSHASGWQDWPVTQRWCSSQLQADPASPLKSCSRWTQTRLRNLLHQKFWGATTDQWEQHSQWTTLLSQVLSNIILTSCLYTNFGNRLTS